MGLFKPKEASSDANAGFDHVAFGNQIRQEMQQTIQQQLQMALGPVMTAINTLAERQQQPSSDEGGEPTYVTQAQLQQMLQQMQNKQTPAAAPDNTAKNRLRGEAAFRRSLSESGKALYDRYGDELEAVLDNVPAEQLANPVAWQQAFEFVMITNHKNEYVKALTEDMKPEDLPPHLTQPGGSGSTPDPEAVELDEDEKELLPKFNATIRGGLTAKQMKDWNNLNANGNLTVQQLIAKAKEGGLVGGAVKTESGNNAQAAGV